MRKACKLMVMGIDQLDREAVKEPFFEHVVGAAVEKMSFRYLVGLMRRCTGQSGTKPVTQEVGAPKQRRAVCVNESRLLLH